MYAVAPVTLSAQARAQIEARTRVTSGGRSPSSSPATWADLGPSWGYFIVAGGVALLVAARGGLADVHGAWPARWSRPKR